MDDKEIQNKENKNLEVDKNYIQVLKDAQDKMPNIILPSMGIIQNEKKVEIDGKNYIRKKSV